MGTINTLCPKWHIGLGIDAADRSAMKIMRDAWQAYATELITWAEYKRLVYHAKKHHVSRRARLTKLQ